MIMQLKYLHDSLNIVVILAPGREFFSVKCAQFPLTFNIYETKLNEGHFSFGTVVPSFTFAMKLRDANYKSHWNILVFYYQ